MKIFGMGGLEIVIILVVVLLIFGPKNLPKLGSAIGKTVSNLRSGMNEGKKDKKKDDDEETPDAAADEADAPAALEGEVTEVVEQESDDAYDSEPAKKVRRVVKKKTTVEEGATVE